MVVPTGALLFALANIKISNRSKTYYQHQQQILITEKRVADGSLKGKWHDCFFNIVKQSHPYQQTLQEKISNSPPGNTTFKFKNHLACLRMQLNQAKLSKHLWQTFPKPPMIW
jgi:hypothetical protein